MPEFELFKDKLNIDMECEPRIRFGHSFVEDETSTRIGEILVFACSYLISDKVMEETSDGRGDVGHLSTDYSIDNFLKVYAYSYLSSKENRTNGVQVFFINRSPLFKRIDDDGYIRHSICVSMPVNMGISKDEALEIGLQFVSEMPMKDVDIEAVMENYNNHVKDGSPYETKNMYNFFLPTLSTLYSLPFNKKGTVYNFQNGYIYETDTALFDFLEEYHGSFSKEHVVIADVSSIYKYREKENRI